MNEMDNDIKVSIICITYNQEKYIGKTLDSFLAQRTDFAYEIIVHDDASNDNTAAIIKEYAAKHQCIVPILEAENQYGKPNVRIIGNFCLQKVRGKYIALCEGDDYWVDNYKLQKQYDMLESNPNCMLCVGRTTSCKEDGITPHRYMWPPKKYSKWNTKCVESSEMVKKLLIEKPLFFHNSTWMIRRTPITDSVYKDAWLKRDVFMLLYLSSIGDVAFINDDLSCRRIGAKGNWNSTMDAGGMEKWYKLYIAEDYDRYQLFNEITEKKYNGLVVARLLQNAFVFMPYKPMETRRYIFEKGLKYSECKGDLTFKYKVIYGVAYALILVCPWIYKILPKWSPVKK